MKITQEETYEFMKSLPKKLSEQRYRESGNMYLQVQLYPQEGKVGISFNKQGDFTVPVSLQTLYPNGVRRPLQVGSIYLWQVVNASIQNHYQQNQTKQTLDLSGYKLLLSYVLSPEDIEVDGVRDNLTLGYVMVNNTDDVLNLTDTGGVISAWLGKQPLTVNDPQTQYRLKGLIQQQDRGESLLDDLLTDELSIYGY